MNVEFKNEHWAEPSQPHPFINLGIEYHERCDAFDEQVLTGERDHHGDKRPANANERRLMLNNARQVKEELVARAEGDEQVVQEAIRLARRK